MKMKLVLDIKKEKLDFILELLHSFKFVNKVETLEEDKNQEKNILENIKTGLEEVRLFKNGKLKTTPAKVFLNEL